MVYRGKPSAACDRCRKRRLRCDRLEPQCSPCIRAKQPCPGYRDLLSLAFRNETDEVIRKVQRRLVRSTPTAKQGSTADDRSAESNNSESVDADDTYRDHQPDVLDLQQVSQDPFIGAQATCFILQNYVFNSVGPTKGAGYLSYVSRLCAAENNPALTSAVAALGEASLSNINMQPALMKTARKEYARAVACTSSALRHPTRWKADSTLAAVILLGMFGIISCDGPRGIPSWINYMQGATRLIELRGPEQLHSAQGLEMFTDLRTQILINSTYWQTDPSPIIAELTTQAENLRGGDFAYVDRLSSIALRLVHFSAAVKDGKLADPVTIVSNALGLESELIAWALAVPAAWSYSTVDVSSSAAGTSLDDVIYGNKYHTYSEAWIGSVWNSYRATRILVHDFIIWAIDRAQRQNPQQAEYGALAAQSQATQLQLAEDICASTPYFLGYRMGGDSGRVESCTNIAAGGYALLWPLTLAAECTRSKPELYESMIRALERIGYRMGIRRAAAMAELLRVGKGPPMWIKEELSLLKHRLHGTNDELATAG